MNRVRRRRALAIALTVAVALGLITAAVLLRMHSAPEAARLLPDCNGIFYADLRPLRRFTSFGKQPTGLNLETPAFIYQTGFRFERDLDEVAIALHAPENPAGEARYSEVMVGSFDSAKVRDYLERMSRGREAYRNRDIFLIPSEDRTVRVTILGLDMVAASNTGDAAQIDHIIDEYTGAAMSGSTPRLLSRYKDVPFGSLVWFITDIAPPQPFGFAGGFSFMPFVRQFFGGGIVVASARYNGTLLLRADAFLKDDALKDRAEQLENLVTLYRTTEAQTRPATPDADMESALNSIKVQRRGDRVEVTASLPKGLLEKMFARTEEPPPQPAQSAPQAAPKARRPHKTR
jgi:hypothetical protein